jgi:hypothetical protein
LICYALVVTRRLPVLVALPLVLTACAMGKAVEQRTTQGPTAEQFWMMRMIEANGREPNFDERRHWQDQIDDDIARYLRAHPEAASSLEVSTFRFFRRSTVGMTKDQIVILLGPPEGTTSDPAEMEKLARQYWPAVKARAKEAWVYPLGWRFYFAGDRVVDITQYLPP